MIKTASQNIAEAANESKAAVWAAEERAELGHNASVDEHLAKIHNEVNVRSAGVSIDERAQAGDADYKKLTAVEKTKQALLNPLATLQGSVDNVLNQDVLSRSKNARVLSSILGGGLQRIHAGSGLEAAKHHQTAVYKNMITPPKRLYGALAQGQRLTKAKKEQLNASIYSQLNAAVDKDGNFDPNLLPDSAQKQALINFGNELNTLSNKMWNDQAKFKKDLGFEKNYLFNYKAADKATIHRDRKGFAALLQSEYGYSAKDATELTDVLANDPNASDLGEAFSVVKGTSSSGAHKSRTLALSENPKFAAFMQQDPFANVDSAVKAASRYTTSQKYLGNNNAVISKILEKMQLEDGMSEAEVDKIAAGIRDFLDAESGNYKRPTSAVGKKLQNMQKSAMMLMTISGLPLATISSLVELALVNKSLTNDQIFGKNGSLASIGTEGAATLMGIVDDVGTAATGKPSARQETDGQELIRELGFNEWDVGAGAVAGVTEVNAYQQQLYQKFFKLIGLSQYTDMTRAIRASMGADYINGKVEIYS